MDAGTRLDSLVAPLRADTVSGAAVVAGTAADILRRAAFQLEAESPQELRRSLDQVAVRILDAQPSMAPLAALVVEALSVTGRAQSVEAARQSVAAAARAFVAGLESRAIAVASRAAEVLPVEGAVATLSSSSTVESALVAWARAEPDVVRGTDTALRRVVCFESRPMDEGRSLARSLAHQGIDVTYAVDAAVHSLVPDCSVVLLGADSVGDRGIVNKIGSVALAHAARLAGVPVYVLCDETKLLPHGFPQIVEDDRPPGEVWEAPDGVTVWNRYFEVVPTEIVTGVVTGDAVLTPTDLESKRARVGLPDFLRRWAEER